MHLTPEQIDRQPFRMTRRGYDIVQVRDFLREIASEMRSRQEVRERLAADGEASSVVEDEAHQILVAARLEAEKSAAAIVETAEAEAAGLIETSELAARERSDEVLAAAQARLDQLLEEERVVHARVEKARAEIEAPMPQTVPSDSRDTAPIDSVLDTSLADFMKSTLRHEIRPE